MSQSKYYQNVLTYESVKLLVFFNILIKILKLMHLILMINMRNHLLRYEVLILEVNFNDVWVECNGTL